jgi:hypothetical protein
MFGDILQKQMLSKLADNMKKNKVTLYAIKLNESSETGFDILEYNEEVVILTKKEFNQLKYK